MLSYLFHALFAFLKMSAIALYMLSIFLFVIYGVVFAQAYAPQVQHMMKAMLR